MLFRSKANYDPTVDADNLEPEYRTRAEIATETGIRSNKRNSVTKLHIYPNPTSEYFRFDVPGDILNISIVDLSGKVISNQDFEENIMQMNVSDMAPGFYIVSIKTTEGTYQGSLMVKK